jgi:hypothetical protein
MKSILQKLEQLSGLIGTADLNNWQAQFIRDNHARVVAANSSAALSEKQVETIDQLWQRHFS